MKHLVGCFESEPLSRPVIQSVLDHSQLFIRDGLQGPFLRDVLAQQPIEVFVAASLPAAIRVGKVGLDAQGLIDSPMIGKLLAVIHRQRLDPRSQGPQFVLNGLADQISASVADLGQNGIAALALDQSHDGLFVCCANDGVALPVAYLPACINVAWPLADRTSVGDLPASVAALQIALAPRFLAAQVLVQMAAGGLVRIDMLVHALVADGEFVSNLLGAPLQSKVESHIAEDGSLQAPSIATALRSLGCLAAGLLGAVSALATTTAQFSADGAAVSAQQAGDLTEAVAGSQKTVDLISFFSAEVLVHRATWTWRFERP